MKVKYNILKELGNCYVTGNFNKIFQYLDNNCVCESQWVIEARSGKEKVMEYYINKGKALKEKNSKCTYKIVYISPFRKLALIVSQYKENEIVNVMLDVKFNDSNKILRIDICDPDFYDYVEINLDTIN